MSGREVDNLDPTELEHLIYDLLCVMGLMNAVWRTPGADGGRDIEGHTRYTDFSGQITYQKWYVECKRYGTSIDWPTVYSKVAYAESNDADFLLLATNNNPSPQCETQISNWNSQRRNLKIRIWRGYDIDRMLRQCPELRLKYNIGQQDAQAAILRLKPLIFEMMKVVQAAYSSSAFGKDGSSAVEAAASISEFLSEKVGQLEDVGRVFSASQMDTAPNFSWLSWHDWDGQWNESGLRAILIYYRHLLQAKNINVLQVKDELRVTAASPRYYITGPSHDILKTLCFWSQLEINCETKNTIILRKST